jgi:hypothetical protein
MWLAQRASCSSVPFALMTWEQGFAEALGVEAKRLSVEKEGDPDLVYAGLLDFANRHQGKAESDELRLLANRKAAQYRAAWYSKVGYRGHYHWLDTLQYEVADMADPVPEPEEVGEIFLAEWKARVAEQRLWPEETDNDRLSRAFAEMNRSGIIAREDFTCCQRCAGGEIFDEIPVDSVPSGFVFFHQQDTLRAAAGGSLLLGFGAFSEQVDELGPGPRVRHAPTGDDAHAAVAERAVATLQAEGLRTSWDHTTTQRITVSLDWKRRIEPH